MNRKQTINNDFYHELGDKWHLAFDHPIALLRAENRLRNPWIGSKLPIPSKILDMGCGAGFLAHDMAQLGHDVTGIDLSESSLDVARKLDSTKSVKFIATDATKTSFANASFDVVCAMDILEHLENPLQLMQEASRLLRPGGTFFFHTFNRTYLSWFLVIKCVEWGLKNTPSQMHVFSLFISPQELEAMCKSCGLEVEEFRGVKVKMATLPFWKTALQRTVHPDFAFEFTPSLRTGYSGLARKKSS